jgi:hypothetical protein
MSNNVSKNSTILAFLTPKNAANLKNLRITAIGILFYRIKTNILFTEGLVYRER